MGRWEKFARRFIPSRFDRAYIALYNGRITGEQFAAAAGIADADAAWKQLCEYRQQIIDGERKDPRDIYHKWKVTL